MGRQPKIPAHLCVTCRTHPRLPGSPYCGLDLVLTLLVESKQKKQPSQYSGLNASRRFGSKDKTRDSEKRWRATADKAGYTQPTVAQIVKRWKDHPELYDDLARVLGGYAKVNNISQERYLAKRKRA